MWIIAALDSVQVSGCIYFGLLRAVLFVNHSYTLFFWQFAQVIQLLPVCYPCKRLFNVLRLFVCLYVYFIDCNSQNDSMRVYGLPNGIKPLYIILG